MAGTVTVTVVGNASSAVMAIRRVQLALDRLKAKLATTGLDLTVRPVLDTSAFRVEYKTWRATYLRDHVINVTPKLDTARFTTVDHFRDVELKVTATLDISRFRQQWQIFSAVYLHPIHRINVVPELSQSHITAFVTASHTYGDAGGRAARRGFIGGFDSPKIIRHVMLVSTALKLLGRIMIFGGATVGVLGLVGALGNLVTALGTVAATATGSLGVLPGLALAAGAAFLTLKLATMGLGDAVKAGFTGDAEQFAKALEKIPPAARPTVKAIVALKPAFDRLRNAVAKKFFAGIAGEITALAKRYLPLIQKLTVGIAADMNLAVRSIADMFKQSSNVKGFGKAFDQIREAIRNVVKGLPDLVGGLLPLVRVSTSFLPGLTGGFDSLTKRFKTFMEQAEKTGKLKGWISAGLSVIGDIGKLLVNVGSIIKSIFFDARQGGQGLFTVLNSVLGSVAKFLNTAEGMAAIKAVWNVLGAASRELGRALGAILPALGAAFLALAPVLPPLAKAVGDFLVALAPILGIASQLASLFAQALVPVFETMGPVIITVASALGNLIGAVVPLLPVIAQIAAVIGTGLATAVGALVPVLGPLVQMLGSVLLNAFTRIAPLLGKVGEAFGKILDALAPVVAVLVDQLAGVLEQIVPPLADFAVTLAQSLAPIIKAIAPILGILATAIGQILVARTPLLPVLSSFITQYLQAFIPILEPVVGMIVQLVQQLMAQLLPALINLTPAFQALMDHFKTMAPLMLPLTEAVVQLIVAFLPLLPALTEVVALIAKYLIPLLSKLIVVVVQVATFIITWWAKWIQFVVGHITGDLIPAIKWIVDAFFGLVRGIGSIDSTMQQIGRNIIQSFINGLISKFNDVKGALKGLTDLIPSWKGPASKDANLLVNAGQSIMGGLIRGIDSQVPMLKRTLGGVTDTISGISAEPTVTIAANVGSARVDSAALANASQAGVYQVTVNVPPTADPAEVGRQTVRAIEAFERQSGRTRLVAA